MEMISKYGQRIRRTTNLLFSRLFLVVELSTYYWSMIHRKIGEHEREEEGEENAIAIGSSSWKEHENDLGEGRPKNAYVSWFPGPESIILYTYRYTCIRIFYILAHSQNTTKLYEAGISWVTFIRELRSKPSMQAMVLGSYQEWRGPGHAFLGGRGRQNFWIQRASIFVPFTLARAREAQRSQFDYTDQVPPKLKFERVDRISDWEPFVRGTEKAIRRNGFLLHSKYRLSRSISLDRRSLFRRIRSHVWCIRRTVENGLLISSRTPIVLQIWD